MELIFPFSNNAFCRVEVFKFDKAQWSVLISYVLSKNLCLIPISQRCFMRILMAIALAFRCMITLRSQLCLCVEISLSNTHPHPLQIFHYFNICSETSLPSLKHVGTFKNQMPVNWCFYFWPFYFP